VTRKFSDVVAMVKSSREVFLQRKRREYDRKGFAEVESYDRGPTSVSVLTRSGRAGVAYEVVDFLDDKEVDHRNYDTFEHALEALWEVASKREKGLPRYGNPRSSSLARRVRNP